MNKLARNKERILLIAVSAIISIMFFQFYSNVKPVLEDAEKSYKNKTTIQFSEGFSGNDLRNIIVNAEYFSDPVYESFFIQELTNKLSKVKRISNLGQLNKKPFLVEAEKLEKHGGDWGKTRYLASATKLGLDSVLVAEMNTKYKNLNYSKSISNQNTGIHISGTVVKKPKNESKLTKGLNKILRKNTDIPIKNVLVRLKEELTSSQKDTIKTNFIKNAKQEELFKVDLDSLVQTPSFYVRTNERGQFEFTGLEKGKNYSVVPITKGKEYGKLKGVAQIEESTTFTFTEKPHTLALLGRYNYKRIKSDKVLTVRTPTEFVSNLKTTLFFFLISFWLFHIALTIKNRHFDEFLLPVLMLIVGVGVVTLYAIQEPLRDMDYASSSVMWILGVFVFFSAMVFLLNEKWIKKIVRFRLADLYKGFAYKKGWLNKESRGYEWLFLSLLLMLLLSVFGSGPEGSGVKVNLGPIQVSEVSKFLMIIFFAKYFTANLGYFRNIPSNLWLFKNSIGMLVGLASLLGIYAVSGDLGPALVLSTTFLVFYSLAKNEFAQMLIAALLFSVLLVIISKLLGGTTTMLSVVAVISLVGLGIYAFVKKKNESMFFIVAVISSFLLLENLPFSFAERLADRNSMFRNVWDNSLYGGDQVAQGIWSIGSGGLTGQGLGNGLSNVMPAYHTDMVFQSICEEIGIVGGIVLLLLFGVLFYRTMLIARRTGEPLLFYLINGVAIATLLQLSIILGGSLGLIPLTGISVPFLSKGNSSLLMNIFFFLAIIVFSQIRGKSIQMKQIKEKFDNLNLYMLFTFMAVIVLFSLILFRYWYASNQDMIRPVKVLSKQGEWIYSYNPRISVFKRELKPGNIYDRNGVLLATCDREEFLASKDKTESNFGDMVAFEKQKNSRLKRYYPFSEDLIYWLGDWNTALVSNQNLGYVADYRLINTLRGFKDSTKVKEVTSTNFKEAAFLPSEPKPTYLKQHDYSKYVPFIKSGVQSGKVEIFNKENRDVYLSLDVRMNQIINQVIRDKKALTKDITKYKTSVVVLNAKTGEVLASAMNPKPSKKDIQKINQIPSKYYNKLYRTYFGYEGMVADKDIGMFYRSVPGSTIKVVNALAYLKRDGADSAKVSYKITPNEVIMQGYEPTGKVDLHNAIVESSNTYFIRLLNEKEFDKELFDLYHSVGINIYNKGGYFIEKPISYDRMKYEGKWAPKLYKDKGLHYNNPRYLGMRKRYLQSDYSFMAWGQLSEATPLQMARLFGAVATGGELPPLNFVMKKAEENAINSQKEQLIENNKDNIAITSTIEKAMKEQSLKNTKNTKVVHYGKTGSAERVQLTYNAKTGKVHKKGSTGKVTDAWYVCYIKDTKTGEPIAIATRIEGLAHGAGASANAVQLTNKIVNRLKNEYFITQKTQ